MSDQMQLGAPCPHCGGSGIMPGEPAELADPRVPMVGRHHGRRTNAPATERFAAWLVRPRTGDARFRVLLHIARAGPRGLTDYELAVLEQRLDRRHVPATRRGELRDLGFVHDTGRKRLNELGNRTEVWALTSDGATWLSRHTDNGGSA